MEMVPKKIIRFFHTGYKAPCEILTGLADGQPLYQRRLKTSILFALREGRVAGKVEPEKTAKKKGKTKKSK